MEGRDGGEKKGKKRAKESTVIKRKRHTKGRGLADSLLCGVDRGGGEAYSKTFLVAPNQRSRNSGKAAEQNQVCKDRRPPLRVPAHF